MKCPCIRCRAFRPEIVVEHVKAYPYMHINQQPDVAKRQKGITERNFAYPFVCQFHTTYFFQGFDRSAVNNVRVASGSPAFGHKQG